MNKLLGEQTGWIELHARGAGSGIRTLAMGEKDEAAKFDPGYRAMAASQSRGVAPAIEP